MSRAKSGESRRTSNQPGLIVLFGSGEMSPTGRKIHEDVFKLANLFPPVKIGILETPTGFEVNAIHSWPGRMQEFFEKSLKNYAPKVTRIKAWRKGGEYSTNDPRITDAIIEQNYIYAGAGSPSFAVTHLKDSLAYQKLVVAHEKGSVLCLGSATAVAIGKFTLPVYEIFKAGHDLYWLAGLDFFAKYKLNLTIIPHWNNQEGEDFDTSRCWMGVKRFKKLRQLLPDETTILGIDEQTAVVVDIVNNTVTMMGVGTMTILKRDTETIHLTGKKFSLDELK